MNTAGRSDFKASALPVLLLVELYSTTVKKCLVSINILVISVE
jgi:hypothetical protein